MVDAGSGAAAVAQAAVVPAFVWGKGELISIGFGIIFILAGSAINRKGLDVERLTTFMSNGIAFGPLVMIAVDPANQWWQLASIDLFKVAMSEARVTMWWAAVMASFYMLRTLLPKKP
ncbi:hypothetical protein [Azospirillum brasilense]|uniref:hypothetical protein n=1 Tax=Azospirillum brasilense TaxID=192 RepID=UPI000E69FCCD|nr:hypothetical protein [Azospirillum brasilense]NUB24314.1 hypothetical protein [Azospirillum brasilense]NUB34114.1 hypothetical protein [Azospirillum brasilense]RIW00997.1 hypothetical protein D2T81_19495 [Azospirillum brasilense]